MVVAVRTLVEPVRVARASNGRVYELSATKAQLEKALDCLERAIEKAVRDQEAEMPNFSVYSKVEAPSIFHQAEAASGVNRFRLYDYAVRQWRRKRLKDKRLEARFAALKPRFERAEADRLGKRYKKSLTREEREEGLPKALRFMEELMRGVIENPGRDLPHFFPRVDRLHSLFGLAETETGLSLIYLHGLAVVKRERDHLHNPILEKRFSSLKALHDRAREAKADFVSAQSRTAAADLIETELIKAIVDPNLPFVDLYSWDSRSSLFQQAAQTFKVEAHELFLWTTDSTERKTLRDLELREQFVGIRRLFEQARKVRTA